MIPVFLEILKILFQTLGPALVRKELDQWEAARAAADAAELAKFGPP